MNKKFCPRCRSKNVKIDITPSLAIGTPQNWICNNCGYTGLIFPELKKLKH